MLNRRIWLDSQLSSCYNAQSVSNQALLSIKVLNKNIILILNNIGKYLIIISVSKINVS